MAHEYDFIEHTFLQNSNIILIYFGE